MAQGAIKKKAATTSKSNQKSGALAKRGSRVIAPKKKSLIAQRKLVKKHTSGLTALTEKNLAEKAGHLELLKGGKKDSKSKQKAQQR